MRRRYIGAFARRVSSKALEKSVFEIDSELKFFRRTKGGYIKHLDRSLKTNPDLCCLYGITRAKPLLSFVSCHSKHVIIGLIRNLTAEQTYCFYSIVSPHHHLKDRFRNAVSIRVYILRQLFCVVFPKSHSEK